MNPISVLMTTEGTYPYASGGVSTWCDAILKNTPDLQYSLLPVMMNPHIEQRYDPPKNVRRIINVPLWGTEEPAEFLSGMLFRDVYERKRTTNEMVVERLFTPLLSRFLALVNDEQEDSAAFGRVLVDMEDYFRVHDYNDTFKSEAVWKTFRAAMESAAANRTRGRELPGKDHRLPTLFDLTEALRWLYRFLTVLNARVPVTSVTHSTAAAFCGIPCITAKVRRGTPMILTEHGVYLREQNLFLSRFRRLFFCKEFLLNLITTIVRANYHFADIVAPVCDYNTRWEVAHGTAQAKIRVIYNGVDPEVFSPDAPAELPLHVVTTARVDRLKDIHTLLHVAAAVRETHPKVKFSVFGSVGDEAYFRTCLELRRRLNLEETVSLGTAAPNVVEALQSAAVVLLTSVSEAFPFSVLEAMSCERVVVASDVGGVSEAVEGAGMLVKPGDVQGFVAAIRQLLDDAPLRRRLGRKARQRVLADFTLDQSVANYLGLYRDLARRSAA